MLPTVSLEGSSVILSRFWIAKGHAHVSDSHGDTTFDNPSRVEPKRSHNWFVDAEPIQMFPFGKIFPVFNQFQANLLTVCLV